ncbi:MAG: DUF2213 domain-containing protein [Alphaproteobacteria bacterium]|nr:DUF2213 domain-containing protein [Alphaproteobacteria bacterium]
MEINLKRRKAEFVAADVTGQAAGTIFVAPDGRILLLQRSPEEKNYGGYWGLPGGGGEDGETPEQTATRERQEEIGEVTHGNMRLIDRRLSPTGILFHTFATAVDAAFSPKLNDEHSGFQWCPLNQLPPNIHPSVLATVNDRLLHEKTADDMSPEDWDGLVTGFLKWMGEEEEEEAHAEDEALAMDRDTVRTMDSFGRMRVSESNISKATVNDYWGWEIPDFEALGLDPDRKYRMLRDPKELARAAKSFNSLPLLLVHEKHSAADTKPHLTIGTTGTDARMDGPYLQNSLMLWAQEGIDLIESNKQRELSCSYRYRADMTPGTFDGKAYDGVMRDIEGNHVAIVTEGRAGPDVLVLDSKEPLNMKKHTLSRRAALMQGAVLAHVVPMLAKDAKLPDLSNEFKGISSKSYAAQKAALIKDIETQIKPLLAKDASLEGLADLLDQFSTAAVAEGADTDPNSGLPMTPEALKATMVDKDAAKDTDPDTEAKLREMLAGKVDDATIAAILALCTGAPVAAADKEGEEEEKEKTEMISKEAMDAAIKQARTDTLAAAKADFAKTRREIGDAERAVRPYVGELALTFDSATDVYRHALKALNVDVNGVHESALPAILAAQPVPGARPKQKLAMDAGDGSNFAKRFPGAAAIKAA